MKSSLLLQIPPSLTQTWKTFSGLCLSKKGGLIKGSHDSRDALLSHWCPNTLWPPDARWLLCDANLRQVHLESNGAQYGDQTASYKFGKKKKKKKSFAWVCFPFPSDASFLLGCTKTGERCRSSCNLKKKQLEEENVPRCLDWPKQTCCHRQLCCLLWHDELGLFSTGSSLDPGSSCQKRALNQSNKLFFFFSLMNKQKQADTQSFTQNRCKHSRTYLENINKIKRTFVHFAIAGWFHFCTYDDMSVIHAMMPLPWEGFTAAPTAQHSSLTAIKKRPITKPWTDVRIGKVFRQATPHSYVLAAKRLQAYTPVLLADSAEAQSGGHLFIYQLTAAKP